MTSRSVPPPLSAKHKGSFAYPTVSKRMPVILTKVIDTVCRLKNDIEEKHGEQGREKLKEIINKLSKLRNELQTDKPVLALDGDVGDEQIWNDYLSEKTQNNGGVPPSWYKDAWLYVECYMYRRIYEAIYQSSVLKDIDPFQEQKESALSASEEAISTVLVFLSNVQENLNSIDKNEFYKMFIQILEIQLWGNRCDLSISAGVENAQTINPLAQLDQYRSFILVDNLNDIWESLRDANKNKPGSVQLDIVLDNAGFELLTDLCLADFLIAAKLVNSVHFHGKSMPWFVSDVTKYDFTHTLHHLSKSGNIELAKMGEVWLQRVNQGVWVYHDHRFWTLPHDFSEMKNVSPNLYAQLAKSDLILFKGDLNYRKLTGDKQWHPTVPFEVALRGFHPAPLCAMRTLKCDTIVGLKEGQAEKTAEIESDWLINANWAVVQYCGKVSP